jgi:hypothetical protein
MPQLVQTPRAARYEMSVPVLYRARGEEGWREGRTVDVSHSGVLFAPAGTAPGLTAQVEFLLLLPGTGTIESPGVRCHGRVVRNKGDPGMADFAVAVTIEGYEFMRVVPDTAPEAVEQ